MSPPHAQHTTAHLGLRLHLPERQPHFVNALQELVGQRGLLALLQTRDLDLNLSDRLVGALAYRGLDIN